MPHTRARLSIRLTHAWLIDPARLLWSCLPRYALRCLLAALLLGGALPHAVAADAGSGNGNSCDDGEDGGDCPDSENSDAPISADGTHEMGRDEECPDSGSGGMGSDPIADGPMKLRPVAWDTGEKWETVTDLVVRVPGTDFRFIRQYNSNPAVAANPYALGSPPDCVGSDQISANIGAGWGWSNLRAASGRATWVSLAPQHAFEMTGMDITIYRPAREPKRLQGVPGGELHMPVPSNQFVDEEEVDKIVEGTEMPSECQNLPTEIRYSEPGRWQQSFSMIGGAGWIYRDADIYGNYRLYVDTNSDARGLPDLILFNGENTAWEDADAAVAWIELHWDDNRLVRVDVYRHDAEGGTLTDSVLYYHLVEDGLDLVVNYHDGTSYTTLLMPDEEPVVPHPDLGTAGDLVMVEVRTAVAPGDVGTDWRRRITQYRYHDGSTPPSTGDIRLRSGGKVHQLKSVFLPQQIESIAQLRSTETSPDDATVLDMAVALLELGDTGEVAGSSTPEMYTTAEKIIAYDTATDRVEWQFVQAGDCGCGSGGSVTASVLNYEWSPTWSTPYHSTTLNGVTMRQREHMVSDFSNWPGSAPERSVCYDLLYRKIGGDDSGAYLWNRAVFAGDIPTGASASGWVMNNKYDTTWSRTEIATPSAVASYTPASGSNPPSVTISTTGGLAYGYGFGSASENLTAVQAGVSGSLQTLSATSYMTSAGVGKKHLPESTSRYQVAGSSAADNVESVTYEYGFDGFYIPVRWRKTTRERELTSENGPGAGEVVSWEFFDERGQRILSMDPDGTVTRYEHHPLTGRVTRVTRNFFHSGSWAGSVPGLVLPTTNPLPGSANGDGELVTEYEHDPRGRLVRSIRPGGIESSVVRWMAEDPSRPGILYFGTVVLPHQVGTSPNTYSGPARFTWRDAGSRATRSESWSLDPTASYNPAAGTFTPDEELSRRVWAQTINGAVSSAKVWWNIAEDLAYETEYAYDGFGRVTAILDGTGTQTERAYDALDRVIQVSTGRPGVTDGGSAVVAEYYYDGDPGAAPSHGVGNGNLTHIERFDGGGARLARMYYDHRDRLIATVADAAPMSVTRYDNLDRPIESAVYPEPAAVPSAGDVRAAAAAALPADGESAFDQPGAFDRAWHAKTSYSQRGLVYREEVAIDPSSGSTGYLAWNWWYDDGGHEIASWAPNSPGTITAYDAHHRVVRSVLTDRGGDGDDALGTSGRFDSATGTAGDVVIEQTEYAYAPGSGVLELVTHRMRHHAASGTGDPDDAEFVTTYSGTIHDAGLRPVARVDFGTNKAAFGTTAAAVPDLTDYDTLAKLLAASGVLFSWTEYDERGRVGAVVGTQTGAEEIRTAYVYDDLGRTAAVIENAVNASVSWDNTEGRWTVSGLSTGHPDRDRVTSFVYDAAGRVVKRVAHLPGTSGEKIQETAYEYGTTAPASPGVTDSLVASGRLLRKVRYPDETTGEAGTGGAYEVSYAYNRLGELRAVTDQNGTVRLLERDGQGRVEADIVETPGSYTVAGAGRDVDGTVRRLGYGYDGLGRLTNAVSYTDKAGTTVRDEVELGYTPLWQVATIAQQHDGAVGGSSPVVEYIYENEPPDSGTGLHHSGNHSRLKEIVYPADAGNTNPTVRYSYSAGTYTLIGRVSTITVDALDQDTGMRDLAAYDRIGMGLTARVTVSPGGGAYRPVLDRTRNLNGSLADAGDSYPAYDRFGRVINHMWVRDDFGPHDPPESYATQPPILAVAHTYDRASNRLSADDIRPGAKLPSRERGFTYDRLQRLVEETRTPLPSSGTYASQHKSLQWDLDMLGNWSKSERDIDEDHGFDRADHRRHNAANEIESNGVSGTDPNHDRWIVEDTVTTRYHQHRYDSAGNMTDQRSGTAVPIGSGLMPGLRMGYDAWNRLVTAEHVSLNGSTVLDVSAYTYNALGWRTSKTFDASKGAYDGVMEQKRVFLYDASWRIVEEHIDIDFDDDEGTDWVSQHFWGLRYIDDLVAKRIDRGAADGEPDWAEGAEVTAWYFITDAQFSVSAVLDGDRRLWERIEYDAYGNARHRYAGDVTGDGRYFPTSDLPALGGESEIGDSNYHADFDVNFDGKVNLTTAPTDLDIITGRSGEMGTALPDGWIGDPSSDLGPDNSIGYAGYVFNHEREDYSVRFRVYAPELGRWRQRDPEHYIDGSNLMEYAQASPAMLQDLSGTKSGAPKPPTAGNATFESMKKYATRLGLEVRPPPGGGSHYIVYTKDGTYVTDLAHHKGKHYAKGTFHSMMKAIKNATTGGLGAVAAIATLTTEANAKTIDLTAEIMAASGTCECTTVWPTASDDDPFADPLIFEHCHETTLEDCIEKEAGGNRFGMTTSCKFTPDA